MATASASITPSTIGQAAEALNRMPGLSPAARRVGSELLSHTNKGLGTAWPGERRMSEALGLCRRTIGRAKKELAEAGVLRWERRGRKTALYRLALDTLVGIARRIAKRVTEVTSRRLAGRGNVRDHRDDSRQRPPQPLQRRSFQLLNGTFSRANVPSQGLVRIGGEVGAPRPASQSIIPDEILNRKAHTRLWESIRGFGGEFITAVMSHEHAGDIENEAVRAERYRPGSGLQVLVELLQGGRR